ncbi:unnamed protein product [Oikopleura dioica]|uniref:Uncharacterized protein n=1 Tax=Oikopleura dioica TaxID=34765 RepID=E4WY81_OIKDI|nr:unnamed protein product [Oikopleura dioica]
MQALQRRHRRREKEEINDKKWFFRRFERLDTEYDRPFSFNGNSSESDHRSTTRESSPKRLETLPRIENLEKSGPIYNNSTDDEDPYGFKENYVPVKEYGDKKERANWVFSLTDKEFEWHRKQHQMLQESVDKGVQAIVDVTSTVSQYRTDDFAKVNPHGSFSSARVRISTNSSHSIDDRLKDLQSSMSKRAHDF